jgi:hypothetical protein
MARIGLLIYTENKNLLSYVKRVHDVTLSVRYLELRRYFSSQQNKYFWEILLIETNNGQRQVFPMGRSEYFFNSWTRFCYDPSTMQEVNSVFP